MASSSEPPYITGRELYMLCRAVDQEQGGSPRHWIDIGRLNQTLWIETAKLVNNRFKPYIDLAEFDRRLP